MILGEWRYSCQSAAGCGVAEDSLHAPIRPLPISCFRDATCPCRDPETVAEGEQLLAHRYRRCRDCRDDGWRNPGGRPRRDRSPSTRPLESQWDAARLWLFPVARCTPPQFASAHRCYRKWTNDTGCQCLVPDGSTAWDRARWRRRLEEVVRR